MRRKGSIALLSLAACVWLASGMYSIKPDEAGVLETMGRVSKASVRPGPHWRPPWPLSRVHRVKARETRRVGIGATLVEDALGAEGMSRLNEFVTADSNIIHLELVAQFDVRDPVSFLFRARDVNRLIAETGEAAATRSLAGKSVHEVFYGEKLLLQNRIADDLRDRLEIAGLGVSIRSVSLQKVRPAPEVAAEFNEAISAKASAQQAIKEAESYAGDLLPRARGEAAALREAAHGEAARVTGLARGEAERFRRVWMEYRRSPAVTWARLYSEALQSILSRARKTVVDPANGGTVIQFANTAGKP